MLNGEILSTVIQLGFIFVIFYLLLLRPQQIKLKQHEAMLEAIKVGDKIVTGGGIHAKVVKAVDGELTVEIAKGVEIVVSRATVRDVVTEGKTVSAKKTAAPKKDVKKK